MNKKNSRRIALVPICLLAFLVCQKQRQTTIPQDLEGQELTTTITLPEGERTRRLLLDFKWTEADIKNQLSYYLPTGSDSLIKEWEKSNALEWKIIDGEKRYFNRAVSNLFRIDPAARAYKIAVEGDIMPSGYLKANKKHLPEIIAAAKQAKQKQIEPKRMQITYQINVPRSQVKMGDTLRCWLPFPQEANKRHQDVRLLSTSQKNYTLAPDSSLHRSIYMEKIINKEEAHNFKATFQVTTLAEWHPIDSLKLNIQSEDQTLSSFISERSPHVVFSEPIRALSKKIVGEEKDPKEVTKRIFAYISDSIPWASAREYSTIRNIPEYVINNKHGDCGQVSLLFITLCRYNGIPAKWQSGFMLHPGGVNLHDWAEIHNGEQWIPVDPSFGKSAYLQSDSLFYNSGIDSYRLIVNEDYSQAFYPAKKHPRSETVDFQRGEVETQDRNLYFDEWDWDINVDYLN